MASGSVWIRTRPTKAGGVRHKVEYRQGGRETPTLIGGSLGTRREASIGRVDPDRDRRGPGAEPEPACGRGATCTHVRGSLRHLACDPNRRDRRHPHSAPGRAPAHARPARAQRPHRHDHAEDVAAMRNGSRLQARDQQEVPRLARRRRRTPRRLWRGSTSATRSTCSESGGGICASRSRGSFTRWSRRGSSRSRSGRARSRDRHGALSRCRPRRRKSLWAGMFESCSAHPPPRLAQWSARDVHRGLRPLCSPSFVLDRLLED
jgi:hypothetical protein